ncbi:unnamed protein product [Auanema sp. JU1783]|nr:unnamed protein product [Auanema sp. JU1783]
MDPVQGRLRPMKCVLDFLERADGSCSYSQGGTSLWASANGPGDVHVARRENDKMLIDLSFRNISGDSQHHKLNNIIELAIFHAVYVKRFPRCCLTVTIQSLQSDGSVGAAALTAASLAILDNGVCSRAPFCGVQVVIVNGEFIVDPDEKTEKSSTASFLYALEKNAEGRIAVLCSDSVGPFSLEEYGKALALATEAAKEIFNFFHETFQRKLSVGGFVENTVVDEAE